MDINKLEVGDIINIVVLTSPEGYAEPGTYFTAEVLSTESGVEIKILNDPNRVNPRRLRQRNGVIELYGLMLVTYTVCVSLKRD